MYEVSRGEGETHQRVHDEVEVCVVSRGADDVRQESNDAGESRGLCFYTPSVLTILYSIYRLIIGFLQKMKQWPKG